MSASGTINPFIGTYSTSRDDSSVNSPCATRGIATFCASFSAVEALGRPRQRPADLSGTAQVPSISIVSPPEFRGHVLGADVVDVGRHPGSRVRTGNRRPR